MAISGKGTRLTFLNVNRSERASCLNPESVSRPYLLNRASTICSEIPAANISDVTRANADVTYFELLDDLLVTALKRERLELRTQISKDRLLPKKAHNS